ncbi:MAG: hypothetical protein BJ554DRAFT_7090 [Olpidium bornovanus]|uniref:Uncharacterized protein n=1 Tax=Olpidium bornovanus TaxID=278681 RepID=A0A8H7ZXH1_9FUNG|nr:MAG: hypothetical protein BJ554DRAFT_7090 [Olpidium bornovanus]
MTSELGRPAGSQKPFSPFIFNAIGGGPKPGSSVVKAKSTDNWLNEEWAAESPFQKSASLSPQEDIQLLSRSTGDFPRDSADVRAKSAPSVCPSDFLLPHLLPASRFSEDTLVDLISEYLSVVTHPAIKLPFDKLERPQPLHHARPAYRAKKAASNCLNVKLDDYKRSTFGPDARKSDTIRSPVAALRGSQVLITGTAENGKREAAFFAPDAGKPTPRIQRGRPRPTDFSPSSITGSPDTTAESKVRR